MAFGHLPWLHETIIRFGTALSPPRLKAIGPIGDSVTSNGVQQVLVEGDAEGGIAMALASIHRLKGFQRLQRTFEADGARFNLVPCGGLRHEGANQVVRQDLRPELLSDQLGVLQRKMSIGSVCFNDLRSHSAFQRAR